MTEVPRALITVIETRPYLIRAKACMTDEERTTLINLIAAEPDRGTILDGGIRKMRFGTRGRGKSGGVRVIYMYVNDSTPVFLLSVFAKNERDNLTAAELRKLVEFSKEITAR
jgi:hypothetical protein